MVILEGKDIKEFNLDNMVIKVFLKVLDILGGPKKLILYRRLTWLPSILEACYVIILSDKYHKSAKEIAKFIGVSSQTVQNILRSKPEDVVKKLEGEEAYKDIKPHIAGGLARLAYQKIKEEMPEI